MSDHQESGRPSQYDSEHHPRIINELMAKGLTDVEVCAELDISTTTLWRWRKANPELEDAYQRGLAKCEKVLVVDPLKRMIAEGHDKGYKAVAHMGRNKFNHDKPASPNATQINIGSINITSKSDYDKLASQIKDDLINLNIVDADFIQIDHKDDSTD